MRFARPRIVGHCLLLMWFAAALVPPCAAAQDQSFERIEIPSSPNPVGSGARALAMGGAFIAVADDATAASWNPAGLIQLERPEVSFVGAYFNREQENRYAMNPEASGTDDVSETRLNYLSAAYPFFVLGKNMVAALTYQNLLDFTEEAHFTFSQASGDLSVSQAIDFSQEGSISAWGLSYALQISPSLSCGFTLNFWEDGFHSNAWEKDAAARGEGTFANEPFIIDSTRRERLEFSGFNGNLGLLWDITGTIRLGAVFKTPFTADIDHSDRFRTTMVFAATPGSPPQEFSTDTRTRQELDMPMSYGLGVAYRSSDRLTLSFDIYRTDWGAFVLTDGNGNETSPISGLPASESDVDATTQVRFGGEYLFITQSYVFPLRGGLFYDPAPAEGSPDDFYGVSIGAGVSAERFSFDIAYQYRFGNDVGGSVLQDIGFSQDLAEHTVYSSLIVYF